MKAQPASQDVRPTVASRLAIGFPEDRSQWCYSPVHFSTEGLRIAGHPVMQGWENDYMAVLAAIVGQEGGRVLEVGYGLGLSSRHILSYRSVSEYWVVECHPEIVEHALVELKDEIASGRAHVISGFWEDTVPLLADGVFDGILFDTYPLAADEIHGNHFPFFAHARRLLAEGGTFTYYSDEIEGLSSFHQESLRMAGFTDIDWQTVNVTPSDGCEYWEHGTIAAPVIRP